jgi:hypothetical protein
MITFNEFINLGEMARETGETSLNTNSKEREWNKFYKNTEFKKLILKDIGANHLKLYRVANINFYLTDENDEYKGQIELDINNKVGIISNSHSSLERGFYNIMFTSLLGSGLVTQIISDEELTTNAINSYEKLNRNGSLVIQVYTPDKKYLEFTRENLKQNVLNRISVTERELGEASRVFEDYYSRIYKLKDPDVLHESGYRSSYLKYCSSLDNFLFCENYEPWYEEAMERSAKGERYWEDPEFKLKYGWE